jgi:DNA (cytosine-5)-methyltransferase 1
MPIECSRLQGFPDWWLGGLETPKPTEADVDYWLGIFEVFRKIEGKSKTPKTRNAVRKWLLNPRSDNAEYKMWGNGLALPCAFTVLAGIVSEFMSN